MEVPFFRYAGLFPMHAKEYEDAIRRVLDGGAFILQEENERFEQSLATFTGGRHVVGVANGTDAIFLALWALGVGPGDEVVLPSHTYVATAAAVHLVGATPVLVECGADHLIDPEAVEAAVSLRTVALLPVQLNGRTADMQRLQQIADRHGLVIVEDAAQAMGARYMGQAAGTFGAAGTYSFYPAKVLGCFGDGGAIAIHEDSVAERVRQLHDHGRGPDGTVGAWGINSRLDNLQAAVLLVRLAHLPEEIDRRRTLAARYQEGLREVGEVILPPPPGQQTEHFDVYQNYEIEAEDRDSLRAFLAEQRVGTTIPWGGVPLHQMKPLGFNVQLRGTDELFRRCLLLPMHPMLSDDEIDYVIDQVRAFYRP